MAIPDQPRPKRTVSVSGGKIGGFKAHPDSDLHNTIVNLSHFKTRDIGNYLVQFGAFEKAAGLISWNSEIAKFALHQYVNFMKLKVTSC